MSDPGGTYNPLPRKPGAGVPPNAPILSAIRTRFEDIDHQSYQNAHRVFPELPGERSATLSQVYASPGTPAIDIVFVHGLNGDPYKTWTTMSGCFWPRDLLPKMLSPILHRVLNYRYDTNGANDISGHARNLAEVLANDRKARTCLDRPIIFVCHSLGGIVVKQALIHSHELATDNYVQSNFVSTTGIIFLGMPSREDDLANWGSMLRSLNSAILFKKFAEEPPLLADSLSGSSAVLQRINRRFEEIKGNFRIISFYEARSTQRTETVSISTGSSIPMSPSICASAAIPEGVTISTGAPSSQGLLKPSDSANERGKKRSRLGTNLLKKLGLKTDKKEPEISSSREETLYEYHTVKTTFTVDGVSVPPDYLPGTESIGIHVNHTDICKFHDADSPGYKAVAEALLQCSLHASRTIAARGGHGRGARALGVSLGKSPGTREPDLATSSPQDASFMTTMRRSLFSVSNIHCASCVAYVTEVLSEVPEVQDIDVSLLTHEVRVSHGISVQSEDLASALIHAAFEVYRVATYDDRGAIIYEVDTTSWNDIKERLQNSRENRHIANCDACQEEEAQQFPRNSTREPDLAPSSAMSKVQQLFVAPLAFRPNTVFVGMQVELETLHSRLFQSKDPGYDNRSVLISGIQGSGKTHLALQYAFTYRESYPGGIFWVCSSSYESACDGFKQIAQTAGLLGFTDAENSEDSEVQRSRCVSAVLEWLATREDWLLVFDGIELEEDDDDARVNFKRLIPRSPKGRIIYTSTDGTGPLLPQPYCIWLGPLQVEDACRLLYESLGIDTPTEEQVRRATTLVERCESLPLAIHALARQIKAQGTSIETFDLNDKTDRLGIGVFHSIVNEMYRLQKRQALNLLHLLSFLDCHTPVRLIEFGCEALTAPDSADILTSPRAGEAPDLGTTIATLLTYALVERTNDTELPRSSPYSERNVPQFSEYALAKASGNAGLDDLDGLLSIEREISGLDVLRTHDVVQNFCREDVRLKDISQLEELQQKETIGKDQVGFYDTWLILTQGFLIKSYDTAQKTSDTLQGRPLGLRDLREYATHIANLTQLFEERNRRSSKPTPWYISKAQLSLRHLSRNIRLELELLRTAPLLKPTGRQASIFEKLPTLSSGTTTPRDDFDAIDFVMTERSVEGHVRSVVEHELDVTIGSESQYVSDRVFSAGPHSTLDTRTAPTAPTVPTSADPETEDSRTVYSDTLTMDGSIKEAYVNELAHELFKAVSTFRLDSTSMRRVADAMPGCLKAFSSRLGCTTSSEQIQRDVTVFIHKYRHEIAGAFNNSLEDSSTGTGSAADEDMPLNDKMKLWLSHYGDSIDDTPFHWDLEDGEAGPADILTLLLPIIEIGEESNPDAYPVMPGLQKYRECVLETPAYDWLIGDIQRHCLLEPSTPDVMADIGSAILQGLPSQLRFSRRESVPSYKMTYTLDWDLVSFIEDQEYSKDNAEALPLVITLTGSREAAQALTCSQYLHQTWPASAGAMLNVLQALLKNRPAEKATGNLPDGTNLVASFVSSDTSNISKVTFEVTGSAYSIAEIGEQLCWLGSALRSSPYPDQVAYCQPQVGKLRVVNDEGQSGKKQQATEFTTHISFAVKEKTVASGVHGECWHNLFRSGAIVEGFPISRRPEVGAVQGLEIPLPMMARLAQANSVNTFLGSAILKGFSAMLIPTENHEEVIVWHLVPNKNGDRISFLDSTVVPVEGVSASQLSQARHILGWCSNARHLAGTRDAAYAISGSHLPRLREDGLLSQAFIYNGQMIKGGAPFLVGYKDTPVHVSRGGYLRKLKWIIQKSVVLWDEEAKRGWLLNGASALLHLVRASIMHDTTGPFSSECLFKWESLEEATIDSKSTSEFSIAVLLNHKNRALPIYEGKDDHVKFEDRVEHFLNILEQIFDYQVHAAGPDGSGYSSKGIPRAHFEGWDFHDLATELDSLHPRLATFAAKGKAWVDFTRSIHAINLLGRDFGEILAPSNISCPHWASLPKDQYYLAAGISDLKMVLEYTGDLTTNPIRLSENLVWHNSEMVFESCGCAYGTGDHADITQVILPVSLSAESEGFIDAVNLAHDGAVVFGYNRNFQWRWGDTGDPEKDELSSDEQDQLTPTCEIENTNSNTISVGSESDVLDVSSSQIRSTSTDITIDSTVAATEPVHPRPLVRSYTKWQLETLKPEDYAVGIVCALPLELLAVRALFDQTHPDLPLSPADSNHYALGSMGRHKIVAACLPDGEYGTNSAADVASNLRRSFPYVKFCLLVGIGGGVPSSRNDIRLGDVVVSKPIGMSPGVIQYDMGKALENGEFEQSGFLQPPPRLVMTALSSLKSDPHLPQAPLQEYIQEIAACRKEYRYPGPEADRLFSSHYAHNSKHATCDPCSATYLTKRPSRADHLPQIHYGLIASGNRVMKDAKLRDRWSMERNVLCFEMEAAGVMNTVPCLVIRGICDYSDSHKNKRFQEYAAATAASYAKLLLSYMKDSSDLDGTAFRSIKEDQSLLGVFRRAFSFMG